MLVVSGCVAKERIAPPATQKNSIREDLRSVFGDVPWRAMFVLTLFLFVTLALWGSASAYYFKYAVSEETLGFSLFNGVGQGITFVAVVTLPGILSDRFGKKATYLVCLALTAVFTAGFYFVPATSRYGLLAMGALKSLAYAPTIPLLWAMMGDVADHGEWVSGRRATGFVFAGIVFALKAGLGLGGAVCGWILGAAGFDPESASQTAAAQQAIRLSVSLIPAALFAVGCVALLFYPISKRTEREMQLELNARRSK
jgi:Na+/melibiose symporter-like transporter